MYISYNNLWKTLIDQGVKKENYAKRRVSVVVH